ncbi:MAG: helix-turn-helix domain-containing protein, partial [Paraclostridium sp.]
MLRLKRKKLMLSQIDASKALGINNTYLSLIENKKRVNLNNALFSQICLL